MSKDKPFNNPFEAVGKKLKKELAQKGSPNDNPPRAKSQAPNTPQREVPAAPISDEALFLQAMQNTSKVGNDPRGRIRPPLPPPSAEHVPILDEDAEVYEVLLDLVEGRTQFDISDSDEFIEGCVEGLDRRILSRLRRGEFSFSKHLDLHGLTRDDARDAVERFVLERQREGHRCVLIIHGRGLNSKDNIPVLKGLVASWMERGRLARSVLAFSTARPHDGGAGAIYVLLRRTRAPEGKR